MVQSFKRMDVAGKISAKTFGEREQQRTRIDSNSKQQQCARNSKTYNVYCYGKWTENFSK